jgi:hypothetical protein
MIYKNIASTLDDYEQLTSLIEAYDRAKARFRGLCLQTDGELRVKITGAYGPVKEVEYEQAMGILSHIADKGVYLDTAHVAIPR